MANPHSTNDPAVAARHGGGRRRRYAVALATAMATVAALAAPAFAAPQFDVSATTGYALKPGASGKLEVSIVNSGDVAMPEGEVTVQIDLHDGLVATSVDGGLLFGVQVVYDCSIGAGGGSVTCTGPSNFFNGIPAGQDACELFGSPCPIKVAVRAREDAEPGMYPIQATASGGGAPSPGSAEVSIRVKRFGDDFDFAPINDGAGPASDSPAFAPATKAFWAGACDRAEAPPIGQPIDTGGVGSRPAAILVPAGPPTLVHSEGPAPITPPHCIDWGPVFYGDTDGLWRQAPAWRLAGEARAGGHPDGTAAMAVARGGPGQNAIPVDGTVDNIVVELPPGFVGNPEAVPTCSNERFAKLPASCPPESQVGHINLVLSAPPTGGANAGSSLDALYPIWNLAPRQGRAAEFGFAYASNQKAVPVRLTGRVRAGSDRGITALVGQIPGALPFVAQTATLWGIPWEAANDKWRAPAGLPNGGAPCNFQPGPDRPDSTYIPWSGFTAPGCAQSYDPSWGEIKPFLTQETDCNQAPVTTARMDQYLAPGSYTPWNEPVHGDGNWKTATAPSPAVVGCESLPFSPDIEFSATTRSAGGATGLVAALSVPQNNSPRDIGGALLPTPAVDAGPAEVEEYVEAAAAYFRSDAGRATAHLKDTTVDLPQGLTVNPSGATGLTSCPDSVIGVRQDGDPPLFGTADPSDGRGGGDCPHGSVIGTVEVVTPLLEQPLTGEVILGEPRSTDPASGEMLRMFLVVRDIKRGLLLKIYGTATADPQTGRLRATFRNNPELPFSDLRVDIKGGERGLLAMPQRCGVANWSAAFTPWSSVGAATPVADVTDSDGLAVDERCHSEFTPSLKAGMDTQAARANGTFSFRFARRDGEQWLRGLTAKLPAGLLASVKSLPLCSNARADAGSCPAGSKIGIVDAKAGAGDPFVLEEKGEVFLTEGYKGGAYGLAVKIRPVAGPFRGAMELSPIVVRQAIHVDRATAQVTAVSDPFPLIHHGVPLRVREVTVLVDRDRFMLNPSSCAATQVGADIVSDLGAIADIVNPFQAAGCAGLAFKPKLTLALSGRKQVTTGKHPGIRAQVTQQGIPEAGIRRAEVRLPKSLALDVNNAQALCEFADGTKPDLENHCPKGSIVGRARATSPLLNDPLAGNVYFVKNVRKDPKTGNEIRTLPMIIVALRGEIAVNLKGESDTTKSGKLVSTFASVPDAPVSKFNLNIAGGKNGILAVTRTRRAKINLCARPNSHVAESDMDGHNGRRHDTDIRMKTPCTKKQVKRAKKAAKRAAAKSARR